MDLREAGIWKVVLLNTILHKYLQVVYSSFTKVQFYLSLQNTLAVVLKIDVIHLPLLGCAFLPPAPTINIVGYGAALCEQKSIPTEYSERG